MMYLVKTKVRQGKVDELAQKIVNREIPSVHGNIVYVTRDGHIGYNLVDTGSENQARDMFSAYSNYVDVVEVIPVEPMGQFIERWKAEHGMMAKKVA